MIIIFTMWTCTLYACCRMHQISESKPAGFCSWPSISGSGREWELEGVEEHMSRNCSRCIWPFSNRALPFCPSPPKGEGQNGKACKLFFFEVYCLQWSWWTNTWSMCVAGECQPSAFPSSCGRLSGGALKHPQAATHEWYDGWLFQDFLIKISFFTYNAASQLFLWNVLNIFYPI